MLTRKCQKGWCYKPTKLQDKKEDINHLMRKSLMISTEVDRKTWLHVPFETYWSTSSDTHQVVEIYENTSSKMYKPF